MLPWNYTVGAIANVAGFKNQRTVENLSKMLPFFYNDLGYIGNKTIVDKIAAGIVASVRKAEERFDQAFGGWMPASNEFGIVPLRPQHVGFPDARWIWTDSATSTLNWSADDTFVASKTLDNGELIYIYGYFNYEPMPNTLELFIQPGANKVPIWNIEMMRISGKPYFILPEPLIIEPRSAFQILAATRSGAAAVTEEAGLMGYYFAPTASLISKK